MNVGQIILSEDSTLEGKVLTQKWVMQSYNTWTDSACPELKQNTNNTTKSSFSI